MNILFVTGIDTDIGKTYATGFIAKKLLEQRQSVSTFKIVQTGCTGFPEDIEKHRKIMGTKITADDKAGLTCPYIFKLPASPHLAARAEGVTINPLKIAKAIDQQAKKYDHLIVEGVGGLCVPLNDETTILDFISENRYSTALVSSPRLGSINHTLMSIELMHIHAIELKNIYYNLVDSSLPEIREDTRRIFQEKMKQYGYPATIIDIPDIPLVNSNNFG